MADIYASLFANLLEERSINALVVVGARTAMATLEDPNSSEFMVRWINTNAKTEAELRTTMKTYALFIATDDTMLPLNGDFSLMGTTGKPTMAEVASVMATKIVAWATRTANL